MTHVSGTGNNTLGIFLSLSLNLLPQDSVNPQASSLHIEEKWSSCCTGCQVGEIQAYIPTT